MACSDQWNSEFAKLSSYPQLGHQAIRLVVCLGVLLLLLVEHLHRSLLRLALMRAIVSIQALNLSLLHPLLALADIDTLKCRDFVIVSF